MLKRIVVSLAICALAAASVAQAQGGGGGGGGGGRRGGGGKGGGSAPASASQTPPPPDKPLGKVEIVGVVTALDPANDRVTIAYDAVEAMNWPAGAMPFVVAKPALLEGVAVGEKVRFRLESQQISDLRPF